MQVRMRDTLGKLDVSLFHAVRAFLCVCVCVTMWATNQRVDDWMPNTGHYNTFVIDFSQPKTMETIYINKTEQTFSAPYHSLSTSASFVRFVFFSSNVSFILLLHDHLLLQKRLQNSQQNWNSVRYERNATIVLSSDV